MCPLKSMHCMIIIILILTLLTFVMVFSMKFKSSCYRYSHNTPYPQVYPHNTPYQQTYPMYDHNTYNKVYGGELDHYRMLFIGTVPLIPSKPTPTKEFSIPDRIIMGDTEGKKVQIFQIVDQISII